MSIAGEGIADEEQFFNCGVSLLLGLLQDPQSDLGIRILLFAGHGRCWQPELVTGGFQAGDLARDRFQVAVNDQIADKLFQGRQPKVVNGNRIGFSCLRVGQFCTFHFYSRFCR